MNDRYELLFQLFNAQQHILHRLQKEELERLHPQVPFAPDDKKKKRPG